MAWGERADFLQDLVEMGQMPKALLDRPERAADLGFVWNAFWSLHTERPLGFGGVGPIPHSAVLATAGRFGMGTDEAEWFAALIGAMDGVYLKWTADQRKAETGK